MTADATARHAALRTSGHPHPVIVLEWLRNSVLVCVLAAALLYLWVATQASNDIGAAGRTAQAVADIGQASTAATKAGLALEREFNTEDPTLAGTGSAYVDDLTEVNKDLTLAAEDNAAGPEGTESIQFVQAQLANYLQLSENAVLDYAAGKSFGQTAESYASSSEQAILATLITLQATEATALRAQRGAWPLDPAAFWWALLGPVAGIFLLTVATAQVLARHFRRHVSRWLWGSLLVTAATMVTVGVFNWNDERHLSADPWAGHPATLTGALVLLFLAAVLAHLAYRTRLAEYRFEPS